MTSTVTYECGAYSWTFIDTDTNQEPRTDLFFIQTTSVPHEIFISTNDVTLIKTYNLQMRATYEDYPNVAASRDFTVVVDFPCDYGVTYTLDYLSLVSNRLYTIGDPMVTDPVGDSFLATPAE